MCMCVYVCVYVCVCSSGYFKVHCLVVWVLWRINLCRLFNVKSIFIQIISSISNNSV